TSRSSLTATTRPRPSAVTCTMPPPTSAVTRSLPSASWVSAIRCCISAILPKRSAMLGVPSIGVAGLRVPGCALRGFRAANPQPVNPRPANPLSPDDLGPEPLEEGAEDRVLLAELLEPLERVFDGDGFPGLGCADDEPECGGALAEEGAERLLE